MLKAKALHFIQPRGKCRAVGGGRAWDIAGVKPSVVKRRPCAPRRGESRQTRCHPSRQGQCQDEHVHDCGARMMQPA